MSSKYIVLFGVLGVLIGAPSAFAQTVPQMEAADLNGRTLKIPQDLEGSPPLLIVAFEEEQQKEIDRLLPLIEKATAIAPALRVWELPLIDDPGPVGRFLIENGMKAGIPSEATRSRVVLSTSRIGRHSLPRSALARNRSSTSSPSARTEVWRPQDRPARSRRSSK